MKGTILSMGLSGGILLPAGVKGALLIGGLLFIAADLFNCAMRSPPDTGRREAEREPGFWASYRKSLRYFKARQAEPAMPYAVQMPAMILLMTTPIPLVPYSKEVPGAGSGALLGGLCAPSWCEKWSLDRVLAALLLLSALALLILACNSAVAVVFLVYFCVGIGLSCRALSVSLSQMRCEAACHGRMRASFSGLSGGFILLIYLAAAWGGSRVSTRALYALPAVLALRGSGFALRGGKGAPQESKL